MKRILFIILIGAGILGGASALAIVQTNCTQCGGGSVVDCDDCRAPMICPYCNPEMIFGGFVGSPDCPKCEGFGIIMRSTGFVSHRFEVECGCQGENPVCAFCRGKGSYSSSTTGLCEACHGEGGKPCPHCDGQGKTRLSEKILKVVGLR